MPMRVVTLAASFAAGDDAAAQILNRTSQPTVSALPAAGWTDHPIRPGVTPIRTVHFDELRRRDGPTIPSVPA